MMNCAEQDPFCTENSRIRLPMFRISLACKLSAVSEALDAACAFMASQPIESETVTTCRIAVAEACNNAILYASETGSKSPVEIHIACDQRWCELCVIDHTPGFDWPEKPELPDPEAEHGRGMFIIHSLMDRIVYSRGPGVNRLIMRKKRGVVH
jgi:anti-sigma regulatory factor (Ser/Thr protein kinase)